jgi:hypothetical protein
MDRGSSKHGPRLDEEMAHETRGLTQGGPGDGRAEEWRDPEPSGEDQPEEGAVPELDGGWPGGAPSGMTPEEREARSRLGRYLRRSAFPADSDGLLADAEQTQAPDDIVAVLRRLPAGRTFGTVAEVWAALYGEPEQHLEGRF